jgi:uncharacterized membrane protein YphA (DoxX/SURF4 family)
MEKIKKYLPWIFRILISGVFLLSAFTKFWPSFTGFEKQLVDLGLCSWCGAHYLARLIVALELAIGIGILQPHFLKSFVIPITILLLVAFCVHLSIEIYKHGNQGNCGCFGQLIQMTPLEAIIKNVVTIIMLVYLFFKVKDKARGENKFINLLFIYSVSALLMFALFPFSPCKAEAPVVDVPVEMDTTLNPHKLITESSKDSAKDPHTNAKDTSKKMVVEKSPKPLKSVYSQYTSFGKTSVNLDDGKKIVCLFAPGCDHCQAAAKEICLLSQKPNFPKVYIFFMDEETDKIPEFFKIANCVFPYRILEIPTFFKLLGEAGTPGVRYLWNGNIMKEYEGIHDNQFNAKGLLKATEAKFR